MGALVAFIEHKDPAAGAYKPLVVHLQTKAGPASYYPDPKLTPGVTNPSVTDANIKSTICVANWTATIRPAASYTTKLKNQQLAAHYNGDTDVKTGDYEEDHFISLELGGNPTEAGNLWPETYPVAHQKDAVEDYLHKQVCAGAMSLDVAQDLIKSDWYAVYNSDVNNSKIVGTPPVEQGDPDDETY